MSGGNRVVVVGSTNTDLVVHTGRLPGPGETVLGGDLLTFAGGKGANQAVAAARAGAETIFIGAFGDDDFGRARRADLEREGVDCSRCVTKRGTPSGVALIAIGEGKKGARSENMILVAPGANARLAPADVRRALPKLGRSDALVCSLEVPLAAVGEALRAAWRMGCGNIALNPAPLPAGGLPRDFRDHCHFVTPNETEFESLFGAPPGSRAARRSVAGYRGKHPARHPLVVVTRGSRGVDLYDGDDYAPGYAAPPKVQPVDTVGAGDCFNGSLAAELAAGKDLDAALRFAVTAAAIKVTRHGAQAGMPRRREVLARLSATRK